MATDPSWARDEKRRREAQAREADARRAWQAGYAGQAAPTDLRREHVDYANRNRGYTPTPRQRELVHDGVEEGMRTPLPAPRVSVGPVREAISAAPERRRAQGLTRVVKTADGAYTDAPGAEGTVRYYDQMGTRVDAAPVQGDRTRRIGPREANRIMDQNQYDFDNNPGWEAEAIAQGRRSIDTLAERNAEGAQRFATLQRNQMGEDNRRALEQTELEQAGEDRRAAAANEATLFAEQIRAYDAAQARDMELAGMAQGVDWQHRERASDPETADAYIREEVAGLMQMTPSQRRAVLTDPNDPTAGRLREAINMRMREATGNSQATAAQAVPTGGLRRWASSALPFVDEQRYGDGAGWFGAGRGFNPAQWGLTDEMFEELFRDPAQDILIDPERTLRRSMR